MENEAYLSDNARGFLDFTSHGTSPIDTFDTVKGKRKREGREGRRGKDGDNFESYFFVCRNISLLMIVIIVLENAQKSTKSAVAREEYLRNSGIFYLFFSFLILCLLIYFFIPIYFYKFLLKNQARLVFLI